MQAVAQNTVALQHQKESVHAYEDQLREQFDRLVKEHQARADSGLAAIATKTTKHAEDMVNYELERQAVILQKLVSAESHIQLVFYYPQIDFYLYNRCKRLWKE